MWGKCGRCRVRLHHGSVHTLELQLSSIKVVSFKNNFVSLFRLKLLLWRCCMRLSCVELKSLWEQMAAEQAAEEAQERERMKRLAAELLEFNQLKQMEMSEKSRRER